jgi:protein-S-isoprenylcysteine O-methyltransferase Ste14
MSGANDGESHERGAGDIGGAAIFQLSRWLRTALVLILLLLFCYVAWVSNDFMLGARLFPQYVSIFGIVLCVLELLRQAITRGREVLSDEPSTADLVVEAEEQTLDGYLRAGKLFGWVLYYYGLIFLFGFTLAYRALRAFPADGPVSGAAHARARASSRGCWSSYGSSRRSCCCGLPKASFRSPSDP